MKPPSTHIFGVPPAVLVVAAVLAIAGIFLVAGGAGGEDQPAPTRIMLLDVSESTIEARQVYYERFKTAAHECARQKCTLHVIVAAGDPLAAESQIRSVTFATKQQGNFAKADLDRQADIVSNAVYDLLEEPLVETPNRTALLRSFVLASREAGKAKGPVDIVVFSDGIENSEDLSMYSNELDDAAITTHLDRLEGEGVIPATTLRGVPISFVLPGFDPGGSDVDMLQVERFWKKWAERTKADLTWG